MYVINTDLGHKVQQSAGAQNEENQSYNPIYSHCVERCPEKWFG